MMTAKPISPSRICRTFAQGWPDPLRLPLAKGERHTSPKATDQVGFPRMSFGNRALSLLIAGIVSGLGLIGSATRTFAVEDAKPTDGPTRKFFEQYCQTCHSGEKPKGDFRVDSLAMDFADKENREKWLNVIEQLKTGTMPPKGKPRPTADEAKVLTDWIEGQVAAAETARNAKQGRAVLRRLNRIEYENTVRDLLGVEVE